MATSQNPSQPQGSEPTDVGRIEKEQLAWNNILKLKKQINKAAKEEESLRKGLLKLQRDEAKNAADFKKSLNAVKQLEKDLQQERINGNKRGVKALKDQLAVEKEIQKELKKTTGGALMDMKARAKATKDALTAEKTLIKDINKERGLGGKIADLFRTKEQRQRSIDVARAKVGGGVNQGELASGGASGAMSALGKGALGVMGALAAGFSSIKNIASTIGGAIKRGLTAPLNEAASILGTDSFGIGGGKVSGAGATSMLDSLSEIAGAIPFIGGLLSGLIKGFKTLLDAVLGINQAQVNFARNQGISLGHAKAIRGHMQAISLSSSNIVVNQTRLLETQAELSSALGITNTFSRSILENNVKLKDIAGFELESRQAIAETSIITGQNATGLTKNLMGQVGYLRRMTGISLNFRNVMKELSGLSGVVGLQFAKYPGKIAETLMKVKVLGFDLKQISDISKGFLNFEESISKEFEAQVLTGKDMNLTAARNAALNRDWATLSKEIAKNVGTSKDFLALNAIRQDAVAESVNMTADGLADVLKKQEMYNKLGADNQKDALANFNLLNKTVEGKEKLKSMLGEENYAGFTQISIAEKLAAVMDKIKQTFIDFLEKSKIFEFLTDEKRVNGFIRSLLNGLAGAIGTAGDIIAGVVDVIGDVVDWFDEVKGTSFHAMAASVRGGAAELSGGIKAIGGGIGPSLDDGGVVARTGIAEVHEGEVYMGAKTAVVLKDLLDETREQNKHLRAIAAKNFQISQNDIAVANAKSANTIYQSSIT